MGVAFSKASIQYMPEAEATTASELRIAIDELLTAAGWTSAVITGGNRYQATTPQERIFHLDVWDDGSSELGISYIKLQARNVAGTVLGPVLRLGCGDARVYWLWANAASFFAAVNGESTHATYKWSTFQVGCPYIPTPPAGSVCDLTLEPEGLTEVWFCAGSNYFPTSEFGATTFRNSLSLDTRAGSFLPVFGMCVDGDGWNSSEYTENAHSIKSGLRLLPRTPSHGVSYPSNGHPHIRTRHPRPIDSTVDDDDNFVTWNPLIAWGPSPTESVRVVGQLYDALLISDWRDLDEELEFEDPVDATRPNLKFRCYTYGAEGNIPTYGGVLALMIQGPEDSYPVGNVAY